MPENKLYSEKEVGKLIEKAYKLQQQEETSQGYGLTHQELQKLASEMGIDPKYLQQALTQESQTSGLSAVNGLKQGFRVSDEIVVEGEVDEDVWESLVETLRSTFKEHGTAEQVGKTKSWVSRQSQSGQQNIAFSFTSKNGKTKIKLQEKRVVLIIFSILGAIYSLMGIFGAFGAMIQKGVLTSGLGIAIGAALWTLLLGLGFLLVRTLMNRKTRAQKMLPVLGQIIEKAHLEAQVKQLEQAPKQVEQAPKQVEQAPKPLINLDSIPDIPEAESDTSMRNRDMA
jgi:hypothetical protein